MALQWFGPHLDNIDLTLLHRAISCGFINDGPLTRELERRVADFIGVDYAIAVTSGTAAIAISLMAAGVGHGDEVIVPNLTFAATANAVILAGARPVLVDIERQRFGIDLAKIEAAVTPKTKAIVPVDVNGRAVDYYGLYLLGQELEIPIIHDNAEAFGTSYNGNRLGSYGETGCFSFSANKTITGGQGGMITTDNLVLHDRIRELKDQGRCKGGNGGNDLHPAIGFNFKITDLQAAILLPQLDQIEIRLAAARWRDAHYRVRFDGIEGIELPLTNEGDILQWFDILVDDRAAVMKALDEHEMGCRAFWYPLHQQAPYKDDDAKFPVSIDVSRRGLWLPSRFDLTEDNIDRVCDVVISAVKNG